LNELDGILYGLLDGAAYKLVLADKSGNDQQRKKKQVAPSLRGVQRVSVDQSAAAPYPPPFADDDDDGGEDVLQTYSSKPKQSFYTSSSIDLEAPPPKRLKVSEGRHSATPAVSSSAAETSSSSSSFFATTSAAPASSADLMYVDADDAVIEGDDVEADEALEEVVSELTLDQILSRVDGDRRTRMAPSEIQTLYEYLRPDPNFRMAPQPAVLASQLFPYQLAAVAWMTDRERQGEQLSAGVGANGHLVQFPELAATGGVRFSSPSNLTHCIA
jgi:hypothetical protein